MNLFVVYIGGSHPNSLIELYDIRFMAANTIENTYDALRKSWCGLPKSLHIDAWGILNYADRHSIQISYSKDGVSQSEIARKLGIGCTSVRRIINTKDI